MKQIIRLMILLLLFSFGVFAQPTPNGCGTQLTQKDYNSIKEKLLKREGLSKNKFAGVLDIITVKLKPHIVRRSNGTGGLSEQDLNESVQQLNTAFSQASIQFIMCSINYIDNDAFFNEITFGNEVQMASPNIESDAANVFFVPNAVYSPGSIYPFNWSNYPSSPNNWTIMTNSYALDNGTLAHETGHYFNLIHTHEQPYESVVRTTTGTCVANCDDTGDLLCDTPADPVLSTPLAVDDVNFTWPPEADLVDANCNYIGAAVDVCGYVYIPDTHNIMSYAFPCRTNFSSGQILRMRDALIFDRPEIASNCTEEQCVQDLTINTTITSGSVQAFQASNSITATNIIQNGAEALFDAGFEITLTSNFDAAYGSDFEAKIGGCNPVLIKSLNSISQLSLKKDARGSSSLSFQIIPNPLKDNGMVKYVLESESTIAISMRDIVSSNTHVILRETKQNKGSYQIPIYRSSLKTGVYVITIIVNGERQFEKLVVE